MSGMGTRAPLGAPSVLGGINHAGLLDFTSVTYVDDSVAPIPEPTTWTLMIAGFGLAGAALRCRRNAATFA